MNLYHGQNREISIHLMWQLHGCNILIDHDLTLSRPCPKRLIAWLLIMTDKTWLTSWPFHSCQFLSWQIMDISLVAMVEKWSSLIWQWS